MTRHDISKADRDLINLGVALGLTDSVEVACDMVSGGTEEAIGGIFDAAAALQHDADMAAARREWFRAYDNRAAARRAALKQHRS